MCLLVYDTETCERTKNVDYLRASVFGGGVKFGYQGISIM